MHERKHDIRSSKTREYPIMTLEYPIMTFSGSSFSNIFSVPKSDISDNDNYIRKLFSFVVLDLLDNTQIVFLILVSLAKVKPTIGDWS